MNPQQPIAMSDKQAFEKLWNQYLTNGMIVSILGKRRSGKTANLFGLGELKSIEKNKTLYAVKFPKQLPNKIEQVSCVSNIPNGGVGAIDEIGIHYPSKRHMSSNQMSLDEVLYLAGQKDITLIATTQQSTSLNLNMLRNSDIIICKEPSFMQIATERPIVKSLFREAKEVLDTIPEEERKKYSYIVSDVFRGLVQIPLPSFWNEDVSHAYSNFRITR